MNNINCKSVQKRLSTQSNRPQSLTHDYLIQNYRYNKESGIFINQKTGKRIGFYDKSCKKRKVNICNKNYAETRLAVFYVTGRWPVGVVKSTSKRKEYNTKFRDLTYIISYAHQVSGNFYPVTINEPKKPTYFQRFLSMFGRL